MLAYVVLLCLLAASVANGQMMRGGDRVLAYFNMNGVKGPVVMANNGSHMMVDARNLMFDSALTLSVDVHRLPMADAGRSPCGKIGDHFNPTGDSPDLGDLSAAPGGRALTSTVKMFNARTNLTLVGERGILGRSVALHNPAGTVVACANVIHTRGMNNMPSCGTLGSENAHHTLRAVFLGRVAGQITLRSLQMGENGGSNATSFTTHLFYTDNSPMSTNHPWHVHNYSLGTKGGPGCSGIGNIYEEFKEMPGSMGVPLTISNTSAGTTGREVGSAFLKDSLMSLRGRSIAIHDPNTSAIIACANIQMVRPRMYVARLGSEGNITVRQNSMFSSPEVSVNLKNTANSVTLNKDRVPRGTSGNMCGSATMGGVFNPFNRTTVTRPAGRRTPDSYPAGDLGNKNGQMMMGTPTKMCDPTLSLFGVNSVARRAVTVTRGNTRMCADLEEQLEAGDSMLAAKAVFSTSGMARGIMYMRQIRRSDGTMGITTIDSNGLKTASGPATMRHNYHVHINRKGYQNDSTACGGQYASGHYNPTNVFYNGTYQTDCNEENPLRCELGDTSKKSGTIDLDNSMILRQDDLMPLMGPMSIMGRSVVIHQASEGDPRVACANIIPMSAQDVQIGVRTSKLQGGVFSSSRFATSVRQSSSAAASVSLLYTNAYPDAASGCTYITAAVDGTNADTVAAVANTLSSADLGTEFSQSPTECTAGVSFAQGSSAGTLSFSLALFVLSCLTALFM